jgi:hypothetical protein
VGGLEEDIEEMEVVDIEVDQEAVDTVGALALEDLDTEVDHQVDQEDMMVKLEKADQRVDTELLVVMTMEVVDTEVDLEEADIVEALALEDLDTEALRVEAMEDMHSVIADQVDIVSHDHLSTVEMLDIMHTHSEENNLFIQTKKNTKCLVFFCIIRSIPLFSVLSRSVQ